MLDQIQNHALFTKRSNLHPRVHAKLLDKQLGYRVQKIENKLTQKYRAYDKPADSTNKKLHYQGTQAWIGLHPQALQTTYNDIFQSFISLKNEKIKQVIDIGAGYGRVGIVMNAIFPNAKFVGYEILKVRMNEGNRIFDKLGLDNCKILLKNVLDENFEIPDAEIYFIYDFSEKEDISKILNILSKKINTKSFHLITNGERINNLLQSKYKNVWVPNGILQNSELKIYSSNQNIIGEQNDNR